MPDAKALHQRLEYFLLPVTGQAEWSRWFVAGPGGAGK